MCADRGRWLSPSAGVYGWSVLPTMANGHDARLLELVEELGGDRVRGLFRESFKAFFSFYKVSFFAPRVLPAIL